MDLTRRINSLRSQAGAAPTNRAGPTLPANDLTQRLSRLQHARRHTRPRCEPLDDMALASMLGGRVLTTGLLLVERQLAVPHVGLADLRACLPDLPEASGLNTIEWVFLDTETSGLAGGTGTVAFMLGLARVESGQLAVRQYLLSRFAGERAMLEHALAWLGDSSGVVSYNGKTFDLPLLKTRSRLAGLDPGHWQRPHLDLLYSVRRAFESSWPDCRLATAEQRLLGVQRHDDLPGSEAPVAWLAHLQQGDASRLAGVLDHNRQDLVSLAGLLPLLAAVHAAPAEHGADALRVARRWLQAGSPTRARALLEQAVARLCGEGRMLLAKLRRRQGEPQGAQVLLEPLAELGSVAAIEQLAKHHEHVSGDLRSALRYARALPADEASRRRLARLMVKQGRNRELPF
jgi:uncharacterized protein YprB with RNaseH-like and TPR domain